jgi:hypothetical protein
MKRWMKEKLINIGVTRYRRIRRYLHNLESNITITIKRDKEVLAEINTLLDDRVKRIRTLYVINGFFYFGIYFSFISLFFSDFYGISIVSVEIQKAISFMGTTVFIALIFLVNKMIDLYYQDLTLLASHIISIYNKNHTEKENLFDESNEFNKYLDFFRKRGF